EESDAFVWASERTGFSHLYLYSLNGELQRPLTQGAWEVSKLLGVSESGKTLYFEGRKDSPLQNHIYQTSLVNKEDPTKLSKAAGFHHAQWNKQFTHYIDRHSSPNQPPQVGLFNERGEL